MIEGTNEALMWYATIGLDEMRKRLAGTTRRFLWILIGASISASAIWVLTEDAFVWIMFGVPIGWIFISNAVIWGSYQYWRHRVRRGVFGSTTLEARLLARMIGEMQEQMNLPGPNSVSAKTERLKRMRETL